MLPELRSKLALLLKEIVTTAKYLNSSDIKLDSQGRLTTFQDSSMKRDVVGKMWRIKGDIGVDANKIMDIGNVSTRNFVPNKGPTQLKETKK